MLLPSNSVNALAKTVLFSLMVLGSSGFSSSPGWTQPLAYTHFPKQRQQVVTLQYQPQPTSTRRRFQWPGSSRPSRTTGGSRGESCLAGKPPAFVTLAPKSRVGQTLSPRPTFVWYLPESNYPYTVTFVLNHLKNPENPRAVPDQLFSTDLAYQPGLNLYTLPVEVTNLRPNQIYEWKVLVRCNPNSPAEDELETQRFEVVSPSPQLTNPASPLALAEAYANAGLWYDAVAVAAQDQSVQNRQLVSQLLSDLAELEAQAAAEAEIAAIQPDLSAADREQYRRDSLQYGARSQDLAAVSEALTTVLVAP